MEEGVEGEWLTGAAAVAAAEYFVEVESLGGSVRGGDGQGEAGGDWESDARHGEGVQMCSDTRRRCGLCYLCDCRSSDGMEVKRILC